MLEDRLREAFGRFHAQDFAGAERLCSEILQQAPRETRALHLLGMLRLMGGNAGEAVSVLAKAVEGSPDDLVLLENFGLAHLAAQDHAAAEKVFRRAQELGASHASLYMRLGLALGPQGKLREGENALRTAAERAPGDPDVHLNLGNALAVQGQLEAALASYRRVLALRPRHVDAHYNLGTLFKRMGRNDEAVSAFKSALALAPDYADGHNGLGIVCEQMGRIEEAIACYRKTLALDPNHVHALNNLGNALRAQGRREEAAACYQKALATRPDDPDAHVNLGNFHAEEGRYADAQALYEKALRLNPRSFEAHFNLGRVLRGQGRLEQAIIHYQQALALGPSRADAHDELGNACRQRGDLEAAAACHRQAIEIDPAHVPARYNLAETLKLQGRLEEAGTLCEQALALKPDHLQALSGLIHLRQHMCRWEGIEALWDRLRREMTVRADSKVSPFACLSLPSSAAEQLACAQVWAERELAPIAAARSDLGFIFSARLRQNKLRVGYLSWGFHRHATSFLTAELFELHDRGRFEVFAYGYGPDDGSAIRARIKNACDRFCAVAHESYFATAQRIYRDGVDILVDLTGYTLGARTQIFALRPAPVQVNWLGYPGTMGTDCFDYIVADPFVIPEGMERHYAEKVVRLPDCYQISDRRREVSERTPTREGCGLPARDFVFCCFNQAYKILPDMFEVWMRIMQAVPGCVLWLAEANRWAVENLRREAAARGVAPQRLVFAPRKPLPEYLVQYRLPDLALDTFPYTSHTVASDALWVGCPLATCVGETFASRVAGSILRNAGLPELVTESLEQYERLVIELARSPERLRNIRSRLHEARATCPLFDTPRFVRNLEAAYEEMFSAGVIKDTT